MNIETIVKTAATLFKRLLTADSEKAWEIANRLLPEFTQYAGCDLHLADDLASGENPRLATVALPLIQEALGEPIEEVTEVTAEAIPATA